MKVFIKRSVEVEMLLKFTPFPKLNDTVCTLKLHPVKLILCNLSVHLVFI